MDNGTVQVTIVNRYLEFGVKELKKSGYEAKTNK